MISYGLQVPLDIAMFLWIMDATKMVTPKKVDNTDSLKKAKNPFQIRMSPYVHSAIISSAKKEGRSANQHIVRILERYLRAEGYVIPEEE